MYESRVANGMNVYMNPVFEYLALTFFDDVNAFFSFVRMILYLIATCFFVIFSGIYLLIFVRFLGTLKDEVGQTQELVGMIPEFVLVKNARVRELVWQHKGVS